MFEYFVVGVIVVKLECPKTVIELVRILVFWKEHRTLQGNPYLMSSTTSNVINSKS
jgi:hypothetical protein